MKINQQIEDAIGILTFEGEFTSAAIIREIDALNPVLEREDLRGLVFNLENVSFIDSSGMGWIIAVFRTLHEKDQQLHICNANPTIMEMFIMTGVDEIFSIHETKQQALQAIKG